MELLAGFPLFHHCCRSQVLNLYILQALEIKSRGICHYTNPLVVRRIDQIDVPNYFALPRARDISHRSLIFRQFNCTKPVPNIRVGDTNPLVVVARQVDDRRGRIEGRKAWCPAKFSVIFGDSLVHCILPPPVLDIDLW